MSKRFPSSLMVWGVWRKSRTINVMYTFIFLTITKLNYNNYNRLLIMLMQVEVRKEDVQNESVIGVVFLLVYGKEITLTKGNRRHQLHDCGGR